MLKNYLFVAIRNIWSNRLFSAINIFGLALGLCTFILIALLVQHETAYDAWVADSDRIYRIESVYSPPGREALQLATSPGPLWETLESDIPGIEASGRVFAWNDYTFTFGEDSMSSSVIEVDPGFLDVIQFDFIAGGQNVLAAPNNIALSRSVAERFFGSVDVIGETLTQNSGDVYTVTAVYEDIPVTSHFDAEIIVYFDTEAYRSSPNIAHQWKAANVYTYIKLAAGVNAADIDAAFPELIERRAVLEGFLEALKDRPNDAISLSLMPLTDIHLESRGILQINETGNSTVIQALMVIAALVLTIAIANYVNLSLAKSLGRAREIALRKVVGARRAELLVQFLGEAMLITFIAMVLALALVETILPYYNDFVGKEMQLFGGQDLSVALYFLAFAVVTGLLSGIYPALIASKQSPGNTLQHVKGTSGRPSGLRSFLVLFQFTILIGITTATAIIAMQTRFVTSGDLGYDRDQLHVVYSLSRDEVQPRIEALMTELERHPAIESASMAATVPGTPFEDNTQITFPGDTDATPLPISELSVDFDFFPTYGIELVAGRLLGEEFARDLVRYPGDRDTAIPQGSILINERAVRHLGFASAAAAVEQEVRMNIGQQPFDMTIVGVVSDINFKSLHREVVPFVYYNDPSRQRMLTVRAADGQVGAAWRAIDEVWDRVVPDTPVFKITMSDQVNGQYESELKQLAIYGAFTIFAIIVACLGLIGLAADSAERRTREIGLRKVLGANIRDIVKLLIVQFSKPVILANLIAWPIAAYFATNWLEGFAYRISLTPLPFVLAGVGALLIAWVTVSVYAVRVARANPAEALRHE